MTTENTDKEAASGAAIYNPFVLGVYDLLVLEPLTLSSTEYDSIALDYLLHCLPGNLKSKDVVFKNLRPILNQEKGVLFGTTILGKGVRHNWLASLLMRIYNNKSIFSNYDDDIRDLKISLKKNFDRHSIEVVGSVAFFTGCFV